MDNTVKVFARRIFRWAISSMSAGIFVTIASIDAKKSNPTPSSPGDALVVTEMVAPRVCT